MNKKNNVLIAILMLFPPMLSFAAQRQADRYDLILEAYNKNALAIANQADIEVVKIHQENLKTRKKAIEGSYVPALLRVIASSLVVPVAAGLGIALYGALGSYRVLNQPPNLMITSLISGPGLGYFDFLKYQYGKIFNPDGLGVIFSGKGQITEKLLEQMPIERSQEVFAGLAAPPLAGFSFVLAATSRYLFNIAANYRKEIPALDEAIALDEKIIGALLRHIGQLGHIGQ